MRSKFWNRLPVILGMIVSSAAMADGAGTWRLRVGGINLNPDVASQRFSVVDSVIDSAGLGPSTALADVESDWTLGLTIAYDFTDHWTGEVLGVWPFKHELRAAGTLDDTLAAVGLGNTIGESDLLPPTFTLQYRFMQPDATIRPYVGAGLTYAIFFDEQADSNLASALETLGVAQPGDQVDLDIGNGASFAFQAGVDFRFNENWLFNLGYWHAFVDKDVSIEVNGMAVDRAEVELDPDVFFASVGFEF